MIDKKSLIAIILLFSILSFGIGLIIGEQVWSKPTDYYARSHIEGSISFSEIPNTDRKTVYVEDEFYYGNGWTLEIIAGIVKGKKEVGWAVYRGSELLLFEWWPVEIPESLDYVVRTNDDNFIVTAVGLSHKFYHGQDIGYPNKVRRSHELFY